MTTSSTCYNKVSGSKSSFSHTCNRLSQYLKEKRSIVGGNTTIPDDGIQGTTTMTTMNLFPQEAGFGLTSAAQPELPALMTIFYGGQVVVLNDLTSDKAKEIIQFACQASSTTEAPLAETANDGASAAGNSKPIKASSDLPITRKGSLQRFFEKRMDRISARAAAPYYSWKNGNLISQR